MREQVEPLDFAPLDPYDEVQPRGAASAAPAAAAGQGPGAVGLPPRPGAGRPGLRPGEAGAAERDRSAAPVGRLRSSAARRRTPATPRSSPISAPRSRRSATCSRCSTVRSRRAYSMTEPHGGSDPGLFTTRAERDGDEWVINGEKWFSSNARNASFFIVMVVDQPGSPDPPEDVDVHRAGRDPRHRDHPQRRASAASPTTAPGTATSATPTSGCPPTTCSAARARRSRSRRPASAAAACTTRCARSRWPARLST